MDLKIERSEESCEECIFLKDSSFNVIGECLLFKRGLIPKMEDDFIKGWEPCYECEQIWWKNK